MFLTFLNFLYSTTLYIISVISVIISMIHTIVPQGIYLGVICIGTYYTTRLRKPNPDNVLSIFGPVPGTKESETHPDKVVHCIAHRGAALDAPENTLEAFKYCIDQDCKFIELDVQSCKDGNLVVLHDSNLQRLTGTATPHIQHLVWEDIKDLDIGITHPNREKFKEVHPCLLDDALDFLLDNNARIIIDIKGDDKKVIEGVLKVYKQRIQLYEYAAVTCFNPFVLYQIRMRDPRIVGAISYRPYIISAADYDAENGPTNYRCGGSVVKHLCLWSADCVYACVWRRLARWCAVSAVLLHKDIVAPSEVQYWRSLGVRCVGWCVNRPLEKLYWRGILKAPYLSNTLLGEPEKGDHKSKEKRKSTSRNEETTDIR